MNRFGLSSSLAFVVVAVLGSACGSSTPPPATQPYAGGYGPNGQPLQPGQPGYQPPPPGYPAPGQPGYQPQPGQPPVYPQPGQPPAQPQPGQPPAPPGFQIPGLGAPQPASGGGTASPLDPNLAAAATVPLTALASSQAPGMAKDGPTVAGNFQAGQTLEGPFTFTPGKCYTLVAQGVGVTQLDLEIQYVTPLPGLNPSVAKSSSRGAQATIGAGSGCLKPLSPIAAQAKFIIKATTGAGVAAAQLYSK